MHNKRNVLVAVTLSIVGLICIGLYNWANQNVTVLPENPASTPQQSIDKNEYQPLKDDYFSTTIPNEYLMSSQNDASAGISLSRYVFNHKNHKFSDQIAISIGKI